MLAPAIVDKIRRLLDEGELSQRKIAKRMRVSRGTVGRIASGDRPDYEAMRQQRDDEQREPVLGPLGPHWAQPGCAQLPLLCCRE